MGEIADALKRARAERGHDEARADAHDEGGQAQPAASEREALYSRAVDVETSEPAAAPTPARAKAPARDVDVEIPRDRSDGWIARSVLVEERAGSAEAYRHFAIRLSRELEQKRARSVMIVSSLRKEGKTTTACNLALALTSVAGGKRTALVDLDLRRPSVGRAFHIKPEVGIESVLMGDASLEEARLRSDLPSLDLYLVRRSLMQAHEQLAGPQLEALMRELERNYDTIVIDTAPVLLVPDAELLFPHVGGCVTVLRARYTRRDAFRRMVSMIPEGKILGSFLNDSRAAERHVKQYGYYYDPEQAEA